MKRNIIKCLITLLPLTFLTSCDKGSGPLIISPAGAPSLCFYTEGNNSHFVTLSDSKQIIAQFQTTNYDAIVIDTTNGLEQISSIHLDNTPFRFAKLLTSGNLYLVSYTKSVDPTASDTLLAFGNEKSVPHLVTNKLNEKWNATVTYVDSVKDVLTHAIASETSNDYFLLAEPSLTALKNKKGEMTYVRSLKELFGYDIPQAALFINKNQKETFKDYFIKLNKRIDNAINNEAEVKEELDKYAGSDDSKIANRFGFQNSAIVSVIQGGNGGSKVKNGFALYPSTSKYTCAEINKFLDNVGYDITKRYTEDYFIDVDN